MTDSFFKPLPFTGRIPAEIIISAPHDDVIKARAANATRYMPLTPCRHGHYSDRFVSTKQCVECAAKYRKGAKAGIAPPPPAPPGPLPHCLTSLRNMAAACPKCDRRAMCRGAMRADVLARAAYAFPVYGTYPRKVAIARGSPVYLPESPCRKCGKIAWRRTRDSACSGCECPGAYR